jgi:site-specific DNA recombinase
MRQAKQPIRETAVVYLRAATANQAEQDEAINAQREMCRREADRLGVNVIGEFVDRGASGNDATRRGLIRLLRFVTKRRVNYVIVRDHARLSRRHADYLAIRQTVEQAGAAIATLDGSDGWLALHQILRIEAA